MIKALKILIVGDFDFSNNGHHATNLAIEHSANLLGIEVDYYWMRVYEMQQLKSAKLQTFDGVWMAPGPYPDQFVLNKLVKKILQSQLPFIITGEGFKAFVERVTTMFKLNTAEIKVISSNMCTATQLEKIEVQPISLNLKKLYGDTMRIELTNTRFSIYPSVLEYIKEHAVDVEAVNEYGEPEILSLKSAAFGVVCMNLPQICSTRDFPHPLINAFLNYLANYKKALAS